MKEPWQIDLSPACRNRDAQLRGLLHNRRSGGREERGGCTIIPNRPAAENGHKGLSCKATGRVLLGNPHQVISDPLARTCKFRADPSRTVAPDESMRNIFGTTRPVSVLNTHGWGTLHHRHCRLEFSKEKFLTFPDGGIWSDLEKRRISTGGHHERIYKGTSIKASKNRTNRKEKLHLHIIADDGSKPYPLID